MRSLFLTAVVLVGLNWCLFSPVPVLADGKVMPPRNYKGSLEEKAQEAIIIFQSGTETASAKEDLILKIQVAGTAKEFAWVIPFPRRPKVSPADPELFQELFRYVESRSNSRDNRRAPSKGAKDKGRTKKADVKVISREVVGDYEVAVVKEERAGGLNPWLDKNGFQTIDDAEDVLGFYREKQYVFACIKFSSEALAESKSVESHPLRFEFETGGRDGIYFPMKMTSLQRDRFDVNLYVFHRYWLNDNRSPYGFEHRGFRLRYRDWDSPECVADGGKSYSLPGEDPFLKNFARRLTKVAKLFQTLHPGNTYYLTNIQARQMVPAEIRQWKDDLWLFPYYRDRKIVPYDALHGGPASASYPLTPGQTVRSPSDPAPRPLWIIVAIGTGVALMSVLLLTRRLRKQPTVAKGKQL